MVGHQDVGIKVKRVAFTDKSQCFQKGFIIRLPDKDLRPVIAAAYDMIEQSFSVDSGWRGMARRYKSY